MKYYLKIILQKLIALCLFPFRLLPIRQNRILFLSLEGGSYYEYSCNPRYFCEYLLRQGEEKYELVWLFRRPEKYDFLREWGIRTARHFTPRGLAYALTSRVVITNGGYLTWFPFREGQICVNTWHGSGAYKRLENDMAGANAATRKRMEFSARNTAAFVSGCEAFDRYVIRGAFLYRGPILPIGLPRNDILFGEDCWKQYRRVRRRLKLAEDSWLILYAPTFRPSADSCEPLSAARILDRLTARTGEEWRMMYRAHIQAGDHSLITGLDSRCLNVSSYPDTQELLCAADLLITDYSSVLWDYSLTDRPVILYTPDLEEYRKERGFYEDIHDWGFPVCQDTAQVLEALEELMAGGYRDAAARHRKLLGSYEEGRACEELLKYIESVI